MNAEQFLAFAETLRSYALHSGRDLNAANLFVHNMLMQTLRDRRVEAAPVAGERDAARAA